MPESTVVVRVDEELKAAFSDAAKAADRTASQLLRDFMRDFVRSQADAADYDSWFRGKVAEGRADVRAGRVSPSEEVESHFARRRSEALRKTSRRAG